MTQSAPQTNPRVLGLLAIAKENKLDVELVEVETGDKATNDYRKLNKMGKVPTFEGKDGYVVSEVIAIAIYCRSPSRCSQSYLKRYSTPDESYY